MSKKRKAEKQEYKKAYQAQDRNAIDEFGCIRCSSCGKFLVNDRGIPVTSWGHSHNLSVKHYPHLEADPNNFSPRCQNWGDHRGCHEKLDEPDFAAISKFNDFHILMEYRFQHDPLAYNRWVTGLRGAGVDTNYFYKMYEP